jgi:hypothetical protein
MRHNDSAIESSTEAPHASVSYPAVSRARTLGGQDTAAWAARAAEIGLDADPVGLRELAVACVAAGASPGLARLVRDPREPLVARFRALGRITAFLERR